MGSFHEYMTEYKKQLEKGDIIKAYQGLILYFRDLRSHLKKLYPNYEVSSSIYYGYMDMTFFNFTTRSIKERSLKIAIVFLYDTFRFEVWLVANNRTIQQKYWELIEKSDWRKYKITPPAKGVDSILYHILVGDPDFSNLNELTYQIERGTLEFIREIEDFLTVY